MKATLLLLIISLSVNSSLAQNSDFSERRLKKIDTFFGQLIEDQQLAGAITLIAKDNQVQHLKAHGFMELESSIPMPTNAIIPIGSMTKIITSIAVLQLYEDGQFLLSDPIEKYIPEFKDLTVLIHPDSTQTEALQSKPTILDLLRHTSGMGYGGGSSLTDQLYREAGFRTWGLSLHDFVKAVSEIPLKFQPNAGWQYSYSHDILGYLVEVISGMTLNEFCKRNIFDPLQLQDTDFLVSKEKADQLPTPYKYNQNKLKIDVDRNNSIYHTLAKGISGGGGWGNSYGGVVTTIEEFYTICQTLLNYGKHYQVRILGRKTVELMMANHIGDRDAFGNAYGLGLGVIRSVGESGQVGSAKEVYWAGAPYNTYFWIDYQERLIGILFTNTAPFGHQDMMDKFKVLALQAIDN